MSYLNQFQNDGYCIIPQAIPLEIVYQCECALDAFRSKNDHLLLKHDLLVEGMLHRVVNLHYSVKPLLKVFIAAMNAGSDVVDYYGRATLYTSLFFELGSQQSLHRDTPYFYSGTVDFLGFEPEYHGNPINSNGSLVTFHYGYDLPELIKLWSGLDTTVYRFNDYFSGVIGEFTEVYVSKKNYI